MMDKKLESVLGSRWYPLYLNLGAVELNNDRFKKSIITLPAGRRSGKTERFKRHIIERGLKTWCSKRYKPMEQNYFLSAPTYGQAKKIFWLDLKNFLSGPFFPRQLKDISASDLRVTLTHPKDNERRVSWWVIGMDEPARMEGIDWDGGGCDEFGYMKPDIYMEHIQPALATVGRLPIFWFFGVPEGRNHYYELAMQVQNKHMQDGKNSKYGHYTWYSSEVLTDETIETARDLLDPKSFAQEYEASWETKSGLVYYAWLAQYYPKGNIDNDIEYDCNLPVYIGMDFNVDPMTAILKHHVLNKDSKLESWVFDSFYVRNSNTRDLTEKILNKYPDAPSYILTPCQSSSTRQTSQEIGKTDLRIIEDIFRERKRILRIVKRSQNPPISDRVNVINSRLYHKMIRINCNSSGNKELVKDLEALSYKEGTSDIDDSNKMRGHISAALGYSEEYHFDIKSTIHSDKEQRGFLP